MAVTSKLHFAEESHEYVVSFSVFLKSCIIYNCQLPALKKEKYFFQHCFPLRFFFETFKKILRNKKFHYRSGAGSAQHLDKAGWSKVKDIN